MLYSPRYQSVHQAVSVVTAASPVPFTSVPPNGYLYTTTIAIPSECTILVHVEVQFENPGDPTKDILSHHEVSIAYETSPGILEYLQVKSLPYTGSYTYPKGPLKFDVVLHHYNKP